MRKWLVATFVFVLVFAVSFAAFAQTAFMPDAGYDWKAMFTLPNIVAVLSLIGMALIGLGWRKAGKMVKAVTKGVEAFHDEFQKADGKPGKNVKETIKETARDLGVETALNSFLNKTVNKLKEKIGN